MQRLALSTRRLSLRPLLPLSPMLTQPLPRASSLPLRTTHLMLRSSSLLRGRRSPSAWALPRQYSQPPPEACSGRFSRALSRIRFLALSLHHRLLLLHLHQRLLLRQRLLLHRSMSQLPPLLQLRPLRRHHSLFPSRRLLRPRSQHRLPMVVASMCGTHLVVRFTRAIRVFVPSSTETVMA